MSPYPWRSWRWYWITVALWWLVVGFIAGYVIPRVW